MDEAVAMLLAAPALALAVWTLAHVGDRSNAAGRAEVAVELAASAAADGSRPRSFGPRRHQHGPTGRRRCDAGRLRRPGPTRC